MAKQNKKNVPAMLCRIIGSFFIVAVIVVCIPLTMPRLLGYQVFEVISGSMEPAIPTGSLVFVSMSIEPQDVQNDDVIAFYSGTDGSIITHRVVNNQTVMGEFTTKGDANDVEDLMPVAYDRYIGTIVKVYPGIGHTLSILSDVRGKALAIGLLVIALLFHAIAARFEQEDEDDED